MQLLIDGYNFIGRQGGLHGDIEGKRQRLLADLSQYRQIKGHDLIVVFDGWKSGHPVESEERMGGVTVIYSQRGEQADAVIVRLAETMGNACAVVTSDREVQRSVAPFGCAVLFSGEFDLRLRRALSGALSGEAEPIVPSPRMRPKSGNPARRPKSERKRQTQLRQF
jgi:predicted RNA-binding protein with PIN domain